MIPEYNQALIVFVKNPKIGKVKTRLAKTIGDKKALQVYHKLLSLTHDVCMKVNAKRYLFYDQGIVEDQWSPNDFSKYVQSNGNLGDRMLKAFDQVLKDHDKALIIGSDCPGITPEIIAQGFDALSNYDVVFGPANDGGYYLLGLKSAHKTLFDELPWSTPNLLEVSLKRCQSEQLTVVQLAELIDIDDEDDLNHFKEIFQGI